MVVQQEVEFSYNRSMDRWTFKLCFCCEFDSIRFSCLLQQQQQREKFSTWSILIKNRWLDNNNNKTREINFKSNKIVKRKVVTRSLIRISKIEDRKILNKEKGIEYIFDSRSIKNMLYGCLILKFFFIIGKLNKLLNNKFR